MRNDTVSPMGGSPDLPSLAWSTVIHRDGTRTITHAGQAIGHYSRIHYKHARGKAAGWRGVTHRGTLVYAPTERRVRELVREAYQA